MTGLPKCEACGQPQGTGTLLDQFPDPPPAGSSLNRLYMLLANDFETPIESLNSNVEISQETWTDWASQRRCIICVEVEKGDSQDE